MWVCIEIQTEDLEIWHDVDRVLANELGLTHIIWGVKKEENSKPACCKLPSNLFYIETTEKECGLKSRIVALLKPLKLSYNLMVMGDSWSHSDEKAPVVAKYDQDDKEVMVREA